MGVTYVVLAPEHPLVSEICTPENQPAVDAYLKATAAKSDMDRTVAGADKAKTGAPTGAFAVHPFTGAKTPIWIADYVLGGYGTGAVMAVPAHDERDFAFAATFGLPVQRVVAPTDADADEELEEAFVNHGVTVNSGEFDGLTTAECKTSVAQALADKGAGGTQITYKLRDWVFSRQRYWGEPIPIYFPVDFPEGTDPSSQDPKMDDCEHTIRFDKPIPLDEAELPLELPYMKNFEPGDDPAGCLA